MEKSIADLQHALSTIRTGRASVFDNLRMNYYGTPTPINQVAICVRYHDTIQRDVSQSERLKSVLTSIWG
jgi:ribosome recycling factor